MTRYQLFPSWETRQLATPQRIVATYNGAAELVVIDGIAYNEPFLKAIERYWRR